MEQGQTGSEVQLAPASVQEAGLSLQKLEDMLSDIRFQPRWRDDAARYDDYYDGHQLTQERLSRMERLGLPPSITNLIAPSINAVLGMEAKTRTDWRVTEENEIQDTPEDMLDAMNAKLNEAERESRADRAISDAYAPQIKSGIGWVEVSRSSDAMAYPYRVSSVHRDEMWWDMRSRQPDLSDARYVIRKRAFDQDILIAMMPEHAKLIQWSIEDRFRTWQWDTKSNVDTMLANAANAERITNIDSLEWRNADRKRATLFEVWYRQWRRALVLRLPTGKVIPFKPNDPRHAEAVQAGLIAPYEATFSEVRVAFYLGCHRLYDMPSPYAHRFFPYVPFFGYRESVSGVPYGLIRNMMSPQDMVNSADSKMQWMLNSRRLRAHSDAIDKTYNTWANVKENLARPDSIILLDPSKPNAKFDEASGTELSAQQFQRRQQSASDIENAGGVYRSMLGNDSNASSGIAISSLVEQGNITLAEINDNYQYARRQVGELLFSMVREDMLHAEMPVVVKKEGKRKTVVLNQRTDNGIANEVAAVPSKVVLEDVPSTPAFRQQQLQMLSQYTKGLPPEFQMAIADVVIGLTDMPQKDKILARIKKLAKIQDDLSPEEEAQQEGEDKQAQQAQKQLVDAQNKLAMEKAAAETEVLRAKVAQMELQGQKIDSERLLTMVTAMYEAIQAGNIVATVPGSAAIADEILNGAGHVPGGKVIDLSLRDQPPVAQVPVENNVDGAQIPSLQQADGAQHGIETPNNDGAAMPA